MLLGNPGNKRAQILEIILLEKPGNYHDTPSLPSLTLCRAEISAFFSLCCLHAICQPQPLGQSKPVLGIYKIYYMPTLFSSTRPT